jgi:hypothetical protein
MRIGRCQPGDATTAQQVRCFWRSRPGDVEVAAGQRRGTRLVKPQWWQRSGSILWNTVGAAGNGATHVDQVLLQTVFQQLG